MLTLIIVSVAVLLLESEDVSDVSVSSALSFLKNTVNNTKDLKGTRHSKVQFTFFYNINEDIAG